MKTKARRTLMIAAGCMALVVLSIVWYVRANPRIFNESFLGHAHCIGQAGNAFSLYAKDHGGRFPVHTNGYGDAMLLLDPDYLTSFEMITGPCFTGDVFKEAKSSGTNINEVACGRVYIQGLAEGMNPEIVLLYDKLPTPGDHTHGFSRFIRSFGREVLFISGNHQLISTNTWPGFASNQIKLLVETGIPESVAKSYYENLPD